MKQQRYTDLANALSVQCVQLELIHVGECVIESNGYLTVCDKCIVLLVSIH